MRIAFLTLLTSVAAAPTFAADLGTYRPGTPYHSVIVPTANVCESQCAGDARCRGWNYVKAAPQAPGVCEFQSQVGQPVSSAISISGLNGSSGLVSSRIVAGNTNTVRVGTAVAPQSAPSQTATQTISQSGRRIIRQPVPSQMQPSRVQPNTIGASYPTAQPGLRPMLDGYQAPIAAQPQTYRAPTAQPAISRGPARQAPQQMRAPARTAVQPSPYGVQQPTYQTQPHNRAQIQPQTQPLAFAQPSGRPAIGQTIAAPPRTQISQASAQPQYQQPLPQSAQPMPRASVNNPVSWQNTPPSLYGRLNDDVRVPASNMPVPQDPNASIPTAIARPAIPVQQIPLAGARPR